MNIENFDCIRFYIIIISRPVTLSIGSTLKEHNMGCACSCTKRETVNIVIDQKLNDNPHSSSKNYKLLLLGAGGGGKSTILKQMRIIHGTGYSPAERMAYRNVIHLNAIEGLNAILKSMKNLKLSFGEGIRSTYVERFSELTKNVSNVKITPELRQLMMTLWEDEGLKARLYQITEYELSDSTSYFLDNLHRLGHPDYLPTEKDILKARVRTTGIVDYPFMCRGAQFRMVDVGGQRSQRKKWLHCFDDVTGK